MIRLTLAWLAGLCVGLFAGFVVGLRDKRLQDDVSLAHALHRAKRLRAFFTGTILPKGVMGFAQWSEPLADCDEVVEYLDAEHKRAVAKREG